MDNEKVVGMVSGNPVYFDGFIYYMKIDGRIMAIDEKKLNLR